MDLGLRDRACVVTGASRGIGRATARMLCAEGASVLLVARTEDQLLEAADDAPPPAGTTAAAPSRWPATSPTRRRPSGSSREATERFGPLDVLVNNAGTAKWRDLDDVPDEDWYEAWELNVMAPMRLMRAAAPGNARARLGPRSSTSPAPPASGPRRRWPSTRWPRRPSSPSPASTPTASPPTASSSTRSARARSSRSSGWRRAACSTSRRSCAGHDTRDEALDAAGSKRPIGRLAEVDEIAGAIVFLCSEHASYVAGAAWSVDGGTVQVII